MAATRSPKRGDRLVLVAPVLEDEARDGEQVRHVGDAGPLAHLPGVEPRGEAKRLLEARPERRSDRRRTHGREVSPRNG
jgi:hypothetical protein